MSYLRGSAAGPVRGSHGDVDTGRGLCVGGVSPLCSGEPGDNQAAGETALPKQKAEGGRRGGNLESVGVNGVHEQTVSWCVYGWRVDRCGWRSHLTGALLMLRCLELRADPSCSWETRDLKTKREFLYNETHLPTHVQLKINIYLREYRGYGSVKGQLAVGQTLDKSMVGAWVQDGAWLAGDGGALTLRLHWPAAVLSPS